MRQLELLAPARDINIGIAAIDCGADAVYIAGPQFGARQAAGNTIDDIARLCSYAHRFGARIFVALNTILYDNELEAAYRQMMAVQEAGADALIIQDLAVLEMVRKGYGELKKDFHIPLHASTQCAIRTPEQAVWLESLGFSRLILERALSLEQIRTIRDSVSCELEFFVHGALCVCYSGQCYLSEKIAGRSANRGACIQACRSRYDLADASGRIIVKDKALLSLKDYNLKSRLEELAEAGITSFKIEGRLKNASYVKNVVRDYSTGLDGIVARHPDAYERGSYGKVSGGFVPDTAKTFNRGYTQLYLDGKRGKWAAMDAAKSMGEEVGTVTEVGRNRKSISIRPAYKGLKLSNGDGFSFVAKDGSISGFRGDVCEGLTIRCRQECDIFVGAKLYRNISAAFEKEVERQACRREIGVIADFDFQEEGGIWTVCVTASSEDGRVVSRQYGCGSSRAENLLRMEEIIRSQTGKAAGHYRFSAGRINAGHGLPFMSASALNSIRREIAESLDGLECGKKGILHKEIPEEFKACDNPAPLKNADYKNNISNLFSRKVYESCGVVTKEAAYELTHRKDAELMRTKYCVRFELGLCPKHHSSKDNSRLFLLNNGQKFALDFDCRACEMTVTDCF
ncbi:MAG: DUF3656 domain-containing protein [Bacteroidales bacterium]|nr:DUF3656 domain-containing protein [Bacteroidales bacterium]